MKSTGYIRVAAVTPKIKVGNVKYNVEEIIKCAIEANSHNAGIIAFPELSLTGSTCGDLFLQEHLYKQNLNGIMDVISASSEIDAIIIIGCYIRIDNSFYNAASVIQKGSLLGIVPAMYGDGRCFADGMFRSSETDSINILGMSVNFGDLIFTDPLSEFSFGIEVGNDINAPVRPDSLLSVNGAEIIFNLSSNTATVDEFQKNHDIMKYISGSNICGLVKASAGIYESTTDNVCSGHCIISECGKIINENKRFNTESSITYGDIDFELIRFRRSQKTEFFKSLRYSESKYFTKINVNNILYSDDSSKLLRNIAKNPFVPENDDLLEKHCSEIFKIQATALAMRIEHTKAEKVTIGISGGLDSTLSLLICVEAMRLLGKPASDVIAITMPGFGTSDRTHDNAKIIMETLGVDNREIPINDAIDQHFKLIGHDPNIHDVTYENAQARERTQILMDVASDEKGFTVGTGDLSEIALGWSTYNGDHMSMYSVNSDIPKTMVRNIVGWVADNIISDKNVFSGYSDDNTLLSKALHDIMITPVSPELLPPDKDGNIDQKTEERIGPYILNEFFLYHMIRHGMRPEKLYNLARSAFDGDYDDDNIKKWLREFYRRFFTQQFKRNCIPDGPTVGSVALSPRGAWKMPSDSDMSTWLEEIDNL